MTPVERWLIDKSAYARLGRSSDAAEWAERIGRGLVHVTTPTVLEVGFSARSAGDWTAVVTTPPLSLMPVENATPLIEARAVEVQEPWRAAGTTEHRRSRICLSPPRLSWPD